MAKAFDVFPNSTNLAARLGASLDGPGPLREALTVLEREPSPYASTAPSEVVTCRTADGALLRLLCKYAASGGEHRAYGHRGGVVYEARVYRDVLIPLGVTVPRFYGGHGEGARDEPVLVIDYLDGGVRVDETSDPASMVKAAHWLGAFHAASQSILDPRSDGDESSLTVYDLEYYRGWARRTSRFAGVWHDRFPWLATLYERAEPALASLLLAPPVVIHGEFYPPNVLYHRGTIYPVDWESAAVAAGEIDLATLTEGWPSETVRGCEAEYCRTRWPAGRPVEFAGALTAARLYVLLRWLGDRPEWTRHEWTAGALVRLRDVAERLGLF
jgi:hypothetical protein